MSREAAYTYTEVAGLRWDGTTAHDVGRHLRARGVTAIADRRTTVRGIGVVHRTWAGTAAEWSPAFVHGGPIDAALSPVAAEVLKQALRRNTLGGPAGPEHLAAVLAVPVGLVDSVLSEAGAGRLVDPRRWPTLAGIEATRARIDRVLPPEAVRIEADEVVLLRRADRRRAHHEVVTGPAPDGSRRGILVRPRDLAVGLLASSGAGPDLPTARLAARLDRHADWHDQRACSG